MQIKEVKELHDVGASSEIGNFFLFFGNLRLKVLPYRLHPVLPFVRSMWVGLGLFMVPHVVYPLERLITLGASIWLFTAVNVAMSLLRSFFLAKCHLKAIHLNVFLLSSHMNTLVS